jgi:hypothetical protein
MPDLPAADGWRLRAEVPDRTFTLAIEADDVTARAEHEVFADRCLPLLAAGSDPEDAVRLRADLVGQLADLRGAVAASGMGYLGALAGESDGRLALILLGIAAAPLEFPGDIDPASLLAAMLRHQYPGAAVEEFPTAEGTGVGIRRCTEFPLPLGITGSQPVRTDTGLSQALVPFPEAGLLGTVTGFCVNAHDVDLATVFTATIAHRMSVIPHLSTLIRPAMASTAFLCPGRGRTELGRHVGQLPGAQLPPHDLRQHRECVEAGNGRAHEGDG